MLLITGVPLDHLDGIDREWLEDRAESVSIELSLISFARIAFYWFTGVIRNHIGDREDRFFISVFLGSGIASVVLLFVYAATIGAVFGIRAFEYNLLADNDIYIFAFMFMNDPGKLYPTHCGGVYVIHWHDLDSSGSDTALVDSYHFSLSADFLVFRRLNPGGALRLPWLGIPEQCLYPDHQPAS